MEKAYPQVYEKLPEELKPQILRMVQRVALSLQITEECSGPLPPPEQLIKYDEALPGLAERIVVMTEHQSAHRMELEKSVVYAELRQSAVGQIAAFALAVLFLAGALAATLNGHDTVGAALGTTTVLGLVATFIAGKREQKADLEEKSPSGSWSEDKAP